jgi:hypothetical protein
MNTPDIAEYCNELRSNKLDYANHWGYDFQCEPNVYWPNIAPTFSKLWYIAKHLRNYDALVWADMDVAFTNFGIDIISLLKPNYWIALLDQNLPLEGRCCAGLMVIKNTPASRDFVESLCASVPNVENRFPYDQTLVVQHLAARDWEGVHLCTEDEIGSFWEERWNSRRPWLYGDLTIHLGGDLGTDNPWSHRKRVFEEKYQHLIIG